MKSFFLFSFLTFGLKGVSVIYSVIPELCCYGVHIGDSIDRMTSTSHHLNNLNCNNLMS